MIVLALIFVCIGCDNVLTGGDEPPVLESIRSAVYDPVNDCAIETVHTHNGIQYTGHYNHDGHGHHGLTADTVCPVADCEQIGLHQHSGTHYAGHAGDDAGADHHGKGRH